MPIETFRSFPQWNGWPKNRPLLIAEIGVNHGNDLELAWDMICAAHESGADFVKLQSFITSEFLHPSLPYYEETALLELGPEQQSTLFQKANKAGINLISTPFDFQSADFLQQFDPIAYKVASMDHNNFPLLDRVCRKGRPVMVSCGMAHSEDIHTIVNLFTQAGNDQLILLHCVSDYPTAQDEMNLAAIEGMRQTFKVFTGLSDHSLGIAASIQAAALGAAVIEKHFTTDRRLQDKFPESDNEMSIMPDELKELRCYCEQFALMSGSYSRKLTKGEQLGRNNYRRGIYAKREIKAGEILTEEKVAFLRPESKLSVADWPSIKGKRIFVDVPHLSSIKIGDFEP
jgi:N,N'-diacetyllegionaminate synthase